MDGYDLDGNKLRVSFAKHQSNYKGPREPSTRRVSHIHLCVIADRWVASDSHSPIFVIVSINAATGSG
jgi:hypothetical protein